MHEQRYRGHVGLMAFGFAGLIKEDVDRICSRSAAAVRDCTVTPPPAHI
jgi:hypothetical protein